MPSCTSAPSRRRPIPGRPPGGAGGSYVQRKSTEQVRNRLVGLLHLPDLYALDRLDLTVETSIDTDTQARVANVMERLSDPAFLRSAGMYGHGLLNGADPSKVAWSFVLYERGDGRNHVRVHADSLNRPFDINSGSKLQLGSTAKLRTLATYLQIIAELHQQLVGHAGSRPVASGGIGRRRAERLGRVISGAREGPRPGADARGGAAAALFRQRRSSSSPAAARIPSRISRRGKTPPTRPCSRPSRTRSTCPSSGCMRDVVNYYIAADGIEVKRLLNDPDNPAARRISAAFRRGRQPALPVSLLSGLPGSEGRGPARYAGRASVGDAPQARGRVHDAASARADRRALQIPGRAPAADPVHRGAALGSLSQLLAGPDVAVRPRLCRRRASDGIVAGALSAGPSRRVVGRGAGRQRSGAAGGLCVAAQRQPASPEHADPHHPRTGCVQPALRQLARGRVSVRPSRALARHRDRLLRRPAGGPGRADGDHLQRRHAPADRRDRQAAFRRGHAVRDHSRTARRTRARIAGGGRAHAAAGAAGGGHRRHRASRQQRLRRRRRAASRGRRQDRNRRQPLPAILVPAAR